MNGMRRAIVAALPTASVVAAPGGAARAIENGVIVPPDALWTTGAIHWRSGTAFLCSGMLVTPRWALTAGHCGVWKGTVAALGNIGDAGAPTAVVEESFPHPLPAPAPCHRRERGWRWRRRGQRQPGEPALNAAARRGARRGPERREATARSRRASRRCRVILKRSSSLASLKSRATTSCECGHDDAWCGWSDDHMIRSTPTKWRMETPTSSSMYVQCIWRRTACPRARSRDPWARRRGNPRRSACGS
jgi:hypothetical protein